jgi:hypothetical protein
MRPFALSCCDNSTRDFDLRPIVNDDKAGRSQLPLRPENVDLTTHKAQ